VNKIVILFFSFVLFFTLLLQQASASDVKTVKKGDIVPFDGVLFSKELEKDIREDAQFLEKKVNTLTKLNDLNEKEIEILSKRLELYQEKTKEMTLREVSNENTTFLKHTLYFLSGAIITGLISYGINR